MNMLSKVVFFSPLYIDKHENKFQRFRVLLNSSLKIKSISHYIPFSIKRIHSAIKVKNKFQLTDLTFLQHESGTNHYLFRP